MSLRRWRWTDPLYGAATVLLRGTGEEAHHWLTATFGPITEFEVNAAMGGQTSWIVRPAGGILVLWFPEFSARNVAHLSMLSHEAFHATCFVLEDRGLTLSESSEEAYAYYLGWIVSECLKRLT